MDSKTPPEHKFFAFAFVVGTLLLILSIFSFPRINPSFSSPRDTITSLSPSPKFFAQILRQSRTVNVRSIIDGSSNNTPVRYDPHPPQGAPTVSFIFNGIPINIPLSGSFTRLQVAGEGPLRSIGILHINSGLVMIFDMGGDPPRTLPLVSLNLKNAASDIRLFVTRDENGGVRYMSVTARTVEKDPSTGRTTMVSNVHVLVPTLDGKAMTGWSFRAVLDANGNITSISGHLIGGIGEVTGFKEVCAMVRRAAAHAAANGDNNKELKAMLEFCDVGGRYKGPSGSPPPKGRTPPREE